MRKLSADELILWSRVAATIRPLSRESELGQKAPQLPAPAVATSSSRVRGRVPAVRPAQAAGESRRSFQSATLDGGWDRKLRDGKVQPDRTLDLHGHNLDQAWGSIDYALEQAIAAKERVLLFITGHERRGEPPIARGRIRAAVNDWLAASRHAPAIAAVRPAHPRHGGGGSLYIILRRR